MKIAILCVVALVALVATPRPASSGARYTDAAQAAATFAAEVLDPPTGLAVSGGVGLIATLTWTATVDPYASGYRVYRSTTAGSGYALVATVTPRTTTSTTNTPIVPGTYYFIVRSYIGNWTSVASNEVSVLLL